MIKTIEGYVATDSWGTYLYTEMPIALDAENEDGILYDSKYPSFDIERLADFLNIYAPSPVKVKLTIELPD